MAAFGVFGAENYQRHTYTIGKIHCFNSHLQFVLLLLLLLLTMTTAMVPNGDGGENVKGSYAQINKHNTNLKII